MNKLIEFGQKVEFILDYNWEGEGIIHGIWGNHVVVELSKPCKEFGIGEMLIVGHDELVLI